MLTTAKENFCCDGGRTRLEFACNEIEFQRRMWDASHYDQAAQFCVYKT